MPDARTQQDYDAILVVSFGGPEGMDDVMPFLENVTRGRGVPRARLEEVAEHYRSFGGVSPINAQNRDLISSLQSELTAHGFDLPIYFGNRNWHPLLPDTVRDMAKDGVKKALAFVTAAYSSYSSCRQYRENISAAQEHVGHDAPRIDKIRVFYNHPLFIDVQAELLSEALAKLPPDQLAGARVLFTAHSIPSSMAGQCDYEEQLRETAELTMRRLAEGFDAQPDRAWELVYQSRSGSPQVPWLEPDVCDRIRQLAAEKTTTAVAVAPIGFLSDHVEVLYDLDEEAAETSAEHGIRMVRAATVGTHPKFIAMIRRLIEERLDRTKPRQAIGRFGPRADACPTGCCPAPQRMAASSTPNVSRRES